jgi:uncharacterized protein (DUF433 family)
MKIPNGDETITGMIWGFSADHVRTLTGLSHRQLSYWDGTQFFSPQHADARRRRPYSRVYSYRDLVGLRVIALLRKQHRVPLQELRRVGAWLAKNLSVRPESAWGNITFYVLGPHVYFDDPTEQIRMSGQELQPALPIEMSRITGELAESIRRMRERRHQIGQISRHRYVAHNEPVVAGTRIPTRAIWNLHKAGYGERRIIDEYPRLRPRDVRAAIAHEERRQKAG